MEGWGVCGSFFIVFFVKRYRVLKRGSKDGFFEDLGVGCVDICL